MPLSPKVNITALESISQKRFAQARMFLSILFSNILGYLFVKKQHHVKLVSVEYLGSLYTYIKEFFWENSERFLFVRYFRKKSVNLYSGVLNKFLELTDKFSDFHIFTDICYIHIYEYIQIYVKISDKSKMLMWHKLLYTDRLMLNLHSVSKLMYKVN